jgi:small-conductance mechanosensitive channel
VFAANLGPEALVRLGISVLFLIGAGVLGIVVEVAARQTLGAMLVGFVLMFSRAFEVGDWIEVVEDEGIVTDIAIVTTRIRTVDAERAAEVVQDAVETLDEPMTVPTPQVVLERFDDSAVILGVRYWIDNPSARRRWRSKTAVIGEVKRAFEDAGIKIPFPQRELMGREEANRFVLAGGDENAGEARKP